MVAERPISKPVWRPILWASLIFLTSCGIVTTGQLASAVTSVTAGSVTNSGFTAFWGLGWWLFVKGWHAAEFGILYYLTASSLRTRSGMSLAFAATFAILDEFHQLFVPHRGCRLSDVFIDWTGILMAWSWLRFRPRFLYAALCFAFALGIIYTLSVCPFGLVELPGTDKIPWPA